jgi:hypothetical protein
MLKEYRAVGIFIELNKLMLIKRINYFQKAKAIP